MVTLLVDPPLLFATGYGLGRLSSDDRLSARVAGGVSSTVLGLSVATYCDAPFMRPVWKRLGGRSGRDLILNSWVLAFDPEVRCGRRRAVVALLFAAYPVWTAAGLAAGRRRRRRRT